MVHGVLHFSEDLVTAVTAWAPLFEPERGRRQGCGEDGGLPLMCHALARHIIFATPEALTAPHPAAGRQRYLGRRPAHANSLAVPYLGHVHRLSMQARAAALAAASVVAEKRLLASVTAAPACERSELHAVLGGVCREHPGECASGELCDFMDTLEVAPSPSASICLHRGFRVG